MGGACTYTNLVELHDNEFECKKLPLTTASVCVCIYKLHSYISSKFKRNLVTSISFYLSRCFCASSSHILWVPLSSRLLRHVAPPSLEFNITRNVNTAQCGDTPALSAAIYVPL
jgi:hypothetical protein